MKNFEKYIDEGIVNYCVTNEIRTGSRICKPLDCSECRKINNQWLLEEYQEPCSLSHDEYVILKNFPKNWKWIARDSDGELYLYEDKPHQGINFWDYSNGDYFDFYLMFNHLFQFIKWEDEEPYEIAKLIEDYEKENKHE